MDTGSELYARYLAGDETALAELIRIYRVGLICFIDQIVCDPVEAETIAEDVFVRLAVRKPKDKHKSSFKTWLYTIARNQTVSVLRFRSRRATEPLGDEENEPVSEEDNPESVYLKDERDRKIRDSLMTLSPVYREVLWLTYFESKTAQEISLILGKSKHNVETIASRARAALRNTLQKEGFDYEDL